MFRLALWLATAFLAALVLAPGAFASSTLAAAGLPLADVFDPQEAPAPADSSGENVPDDPADSERDDSNEEDSDDREGVLTPIVAVQVAITLERWVTPHDVRVVSSLPDRQYRPPRAA